MHNAGPRSCMVRCGKFRIFSHLAEGSILLQQSNLLSGLDHPTEGTDRLTMAPTSPGLPTSTAFSSPRHQWWPSHYQVLHHSPGRGCQVPTQHKSMGHHLCGARTGRECPSTVPNQLPHWCCCDMKGRSQGTLVEKAGGGGEWGPSLFQAVNCNYPGFWDVIISQSQSKHPRGNCTVKDSMALKINYDSSVHYCCRSVCIFTLKAPAWGSWNHPAVTFPAKLSA